MFDIGASELLVLGVVALIAIGPRELPGVLRSVGQMVGKLKRMAGEFRTQFDDAIREADLHEVQKSFSETVQTASAATNFNPITTIRDEIRSTVDDIKAGKAPAPGKPDEQGPPVTVLEPLPEIAPPVIAPAPAPVAAIEAAPDAPAAKPPRKRAAKKTAGETE